MIIRIGSEFIAPHPYHTELLDPNGPPVYIAQSPTGWVDMRLKTAFFKLQIASPDVPIGQRPVAGNVDGHITNTHNPEMRALMVKHKARARAHLLAPRARLLARHARASSRRAFSRAARARSPFRAARAYSPAPRARARPPLLSRRDCSQC
jgi:hypothetical protein